MVCPMRGVLVLASLVVAILSSLIGWVMRPPRAEADEWSDDGGGDGDGVVDGDTHGAPKRRDEVR
jgi:hypothetical protein